MRARIYASCTPQQLILTSASCLGGFYLRTLPSRIIENAIKSYERKNIPGVFYIHSWELTPEFMPKIDLPKKDNFITYHNINKAYSKMEKLMEKFEFTSFSNFIQENK